MKIGILGAGGVGGLLAALLARYAETKPANASTSSDDALQLAVLARGAHLEAIRARGLRLSGTLGDFTAHRLTVAERGADLGRCDAVFVAVKTFHLPALLPELAAMVGPETVVVPLLNGVFAAEQLAAQLADHGAPFVAGGIIYCNAWLDSPGVIRQLGPQVRIVVGARAPAASPPSRSSDDRPSDDPRLRALASLCDLLRAAGVTCEHVPDVEVKSWEKFLGFEPMALVGALSRSSIGTFRAEPSTRRVLLTLMEEVAQIGRRRGVPLAEDAASRRVALIDGLAPDATISLQRDLMGGRVSELMEQSVHLVLLARSLGVATPAHDLCVPLLLLQERAARDRADAQTAAPGEQP